LSLQLFPFAAADPLRWSEMMLINLLFFDRARGFTSATVSRSYAIRLDDPESLSHSATMAFSFFPHQTDEEAKAKYRSILCFEWCGYLRAYYSLELTTTPFRPSVHQFGNFYSPRWLINFLLNYGEF
jgi:hypothetical protein